MSGLGVSVTASASDTAGTPVLPSLYCELAAGPSSVRTARHRVRERYGGCGSPDLIDDLALVVTELVANAVAASPVTASVRLRVGPVGPDLLIEIYDQATEVPVGRGQEDLAEHGRGLVLIAELCRSWGWHPSDRGKVVWAVIRVAGTGSSATAMPSAAPSAEPPPVLS